MVLSKKMNGFSNKEGENCHQLLADRKREQIFLCVKETKREKMLKAMQVFRNRLN